MSSFDGREARSSVSRLSVLHAHPIADRRRIIGRYLPMSGARAKFNERRWERQHTNGWRSIVVETHEQWYTGWAQPPGRTRSTPALQGTDLGKCQAAADDSVPAHNCRCPAWQEVGLPRRWPRKEPFAALLAHIEDRPAVVRDLSYGGVKLEISEGEIPARFQIAFHRFGLTIQVRTVWTRAAPLGLWWCGAEVCEVSPAAETEWRQLVDTVSANL